jgi:hypothetical protein
VVGEDDAPATTVLVIAAVDPTRAAIAAQRPILFPIMV